MTSDRHISQILIDQQGKQLRKIDEIITGVATPTAPTVLGQKVADRIKSMPKKNGLSNASARVLHGQQQSVDTLAGDGFRLNPSDLPNGHANQVRYKQLQAEVSRDKLEQVKLQKQWPFLS